MWFSFKENKGHQGARAPKAIFAPLETSLFLQLLIHDDGFKGFACRNARSDR